MQTNASQAVDFIVSVSQEYAPGNLGNGTAHLKELDLFIAVQEKQALAFPAMSAFISEINASARPGETGINITCVGKGQDLESAIREAVAQWTIGVLPVLAHWRGKHTDFTSARALNHPGSFEILAGPVVALGNSADSQVTYLGKNLWEPLTDLLQKHRLAQRLHWLEMYCCKFKEGDIDATCRLDNRDWLAARTALLQVASAWPQTAEPLQSSRQFALLLPKQGNSQEIVVPSFWSRLLGKG